MITKKAIIQNELGIHVRPSGLIIKKTMGYDGKIVLKSKGFEMELNSIMDLLALGLEKGDELEISVTGSDEEVYTEELIEAFQFNYDFSPK